MNYPQPYHSTMHTASNLRVIRFLIIETGTYNQQYLRPYQMDVRSETLDALKEVTSGANRIHASMISGISNQFIHPQATPEKAISIANGWEQKRYRYLLELQYERGGMQHNDLVLGYSDYADPSYNGLIDENMSFRVNSIINQRVSAILTPTGNQLVKQVSDSSHVIVDHDWLPGKSTIYNQEGKFHLRPQDLYSVMDTYDSDIASSGMIGNTLDSRVMSRNEPVLSKRSNNIASTYAATMMQGYLGAVENNMGTAGEIYNEAVGLVRDALSSHNVFLNKLRNMTGIATAAFTVRDVMNIDPNTRHIMQIIPLSQQQRTQQIHTAGQTAEWHSSDIETQYASILSQAIPAILMEYGIGNISFISTNSGLTAKPETRILAANNFNSGDTTRQCNSFITRFEAELIRDLMFNNQIQYFVEGNFDMLGESRLKISINGGPIIEYATPSFADALLTPVTTYNPQLSFNLATQFGTMLSNLDLGQGHLQASFNPVQEPQSHYHSDATSFTGLSI